MKPVLFACFCFVSLLSAQEHAINVNLPAIYVVGDSTANNANHRGWADPLAAYFDPSRVNVVNKARGGRSSRTFFSEGLWENVRSSLKPGDIVLLQFGHNDGGPPDREKFRGSLPGLGEETQDVTLSGGTSASAAKETVHTFGWYMRKFIADAKDQGAQTIVLSPTARNIWKDGKVERALGNYSDWSQQIANAAGVPFIDLSSAIADRYQRMGLEKVARLFPEDHTHTSAEGADLNASLVVAGLKGLSGSPFTSMLSAKGQAVETSPALTSANGNPLTSGPPMKMPAPANPALPTLFLIGDSTVRNGKGDGSNGQWGWGEPLVHYFDSARINVVNRAVGGLSSRTYLTQGHWDRVKAMLKKGDFVVMQFGHNDNGPLDDAARARGTIKGIGEETKEIDNPITGLHEVVHSYGWYLRKFVAETRAAGANPIICTLIPRKIWKDGKIVRNSEDYAKWAREVAAADKIPVIDLNELVARKYDELGQEKVETLFADPHTHTSRAGAELNASIVVSGVKAIDSPLAHYLSAKGEDAPSFRRDWNAFPAIVEVDPSDEIYAVGDVHGDCERMLALLKAGRLSDGAKWTGGTATLVFLGDMIDKGPRIVDTLQAIRALQLSALAQGGRVIAVIGNHEAEFLSNPKAKKFADFSRDLDQKGMAASEVSKCRNEIGEFLCSLPIAARVGDWFFLHAGNTGGRSLPQLKADLMKAISSDGFGSSQLTDPNSILEARLGDAGPGGKPWFDAGIPKHNAEQLLTNYTRALGVHHLVQGHQHGDVTFDDGTTRKAGEAFQRWGLLFLIDTGLSRDVDDSTGALLHISPARNTATVVCADGTSTVIWDLGRNDRSGHAAACGKTGR